MTHGELVDIGARWLLKDAPNIFLKCQYVVKELMFAGMERPDIFGIRSGMTVLIEVKVSRSDFLADSKKSFRVEQGQGLGQRRYYLCPEGLINEREVGYWGLLECDGEKVSVRKKSGNFSANSQSEVNLMYSILRRIQKPGIIG